MIRRYRPAVFGLAGVLLLGFSLIWLNRESILLAIGDFLVVQDTPHPVDLIHVLGGNQRRGEYAADLYRQGYAPHLFFSGETPAAGQPFQPEYMSQSQALARGVDPQAVIPFPSTAGSTYEEAIELKQLLTENPAIQSVMIISDPYHMRRVSWTFHHVIGSRAQLYFVPIPANQSQVPRRWWQNSWTRRTIGSEYTKLLYYMLVYLWPSHLS